MVVHTSPIPSLYRLHFSLLLFYNNHVLIPTVENRWKTNPLSTPALGHANMDRGQLLFRSPLQSGIFGHYIFSFPPPFICIR